MRTGSMPGNGAAGWVRAAGLAAVLLGSLASGCGGSGGGSDPEYGARDLYVVDIDLDGRDGVSLNVPLTIEFSEYVEPSTIRPDTVQIRLGPRYGIQAFGDFKVAGNFVTFFPQMPTQADLSDSGFQPQSQYRVTVVGYPKVDRVDSFTGRPLVRSFTGSFATAASTSPDLFTTDTYKDPPPPKVVYSNPPDHLAHSPWTEPGGAVDVPTDAQVQLVMNRVPLLPSTITVTNISLAMIERLGISQNRPIQGTPVVEQSFDGVSIRFVPTFPLADQARYALRVENRVTDLTGSYDVADNAGRTALRAQAESGTDAALTAFALAHPEEVDPRVFLIFTTRDEPTKDLALYMNFDGTDLDQDGGDGFDKNLSTASFNDAVPGAVSATFTAAGGNGTLGTFAPTSNTTLSTNSPSAANGVFNYSSFRIPTNVTVTLTGTLPASLLSIKSVDISGVLGATGGKGGDGESGSYSTTSMPSVIGGPGGPGGGAGGNAYYGSSLAMNGGDGQTAPNNGGKGGGGGKIVSSATYYMFGGGGGGGGHQYPGANGTGGSYPSYSSWNGSGGTGGPAGGIQPTSSATSDGKNFYSLGVGGGGGGAGGNFNFNYTYYLWRNAAAGGGGGGGAILLKSAGDIVVKGSIISKGGQGGYSGSLGYYSGGGGGGGAGGSITLYANANLNVTGGTLDTSGGSGNSGGNWSGRGGNGGGGFIQLEDADNVITGTAAATILPDFYTGRFDPTGTANDAPSVFVSTWFNAGVFDPQIQPWANSDFTEQNFTGCTIKYEIQMARENPQEFGKADTGSINPATGQSSDLTRASNWLVFKDPVAGIQDVTGSLNLKGYQFYRTRITFTLKNGQKRDDPVPYVDRLRIRVKY